MGKPKRIVVAGATGYLGRHVVVALHERGHHVRALVRDPARLDFARPYADEVFVGHATRPETLRGLCDGADVVFSSLGLRAWRGKVTFWDVDRDANLHLLAEARRARVGHFVFVSVLVGGPETLTLRAIGELAFAVLGKPPHFGHVPAALLRAAATLTRPLSVNLSGFLHFMAAMGELDAIAPPFGTHRLRPCFESLKDATSP